MPPQLLIAGHIVKDITSDGWTPGGGALYAAAQVARLGVETVAVTACEHDILPVSLVPDVQWHVLPLDSGISFENTYRAARREQRILSTARPLTLEDVPEAWRAAPSVLLTPVFHDVSPELPAQLASRGATVGAGVQGWLRNLEGNAVRKASVDPMPAWLPGCSAVFVSEEDVDDPDSVAQWSGAGAVVILTRGRRGCTVWDAAARNDIPAFSSRDVDPTGAGDVFAAAFMVRLAETGDTLTSARFGSAAAAIAVEGKGIASVATRAQVEARMGLKARMSA